MKIDVQVSEIKIDVHRYISKAREDRFWLFAAQQWYKLYFPYVPYDTGMLARSVIIEPHQIEHIAPYAQYVYNGNFNFRKDQHPQATREWDKAAENVQKPKLIQTLQAYVDSGRLELDK